MCDLDSVIEAYKKFLFPYKHSIKGMSLVVNSYTNSFQADCWNEHLLKSVYVMNSSVEQLCDFEVWCLYNRDMYEKVLSLLNIVDKEKTIKYHHYTEARNIEIENYEVIVSDKSAIIIIYYNESIYAISGADNLDSIMEFSRIIREVFTKKSLSKGYILLHAAAVEKDGEITIITGEKGAGKTTSVINLLRQGYNLVSNDRVFICLNNGELHCWTWPGCVAISVDAVNRYSEMSKIADELEFFSYPQQRMKSLEEFKNDTDEYICHNPNDKFDLSCEEMANIYNVKYITKGLVKKVINIYFNQEKAVYNNLLYPVDKSYPDWLTLGEKNKVSDLVYCKIKENLVEHTDILKMNHDGMDCNRLLHLIQI